MTILSFDIKTDEFCKTLYFQDSTGTYNSIDNPNGWGAPNTDIGDVVSSEIQVELPDGTVYTFDSTTYLPTLTPIYNFSVLATDLGSSGKFINGIYKITYSVTLTNNSVLTTYCYFDIICDICCKLDKLLAELSVEDCNCNDNSEVNSLLRAWVIRHNIQFMVNCGNIQSAKNLIKALELIVSSKQCKTC